LRKLVAVECFVTRCELFHVCFPFQCCVGLL
jgi:hypothetical protein